MQGTGPIVDEIHPRCVIIAEHEAGPRLAACLTFERAGFTVRVASSATDLAALLSSVANISVVLIDARLPGLDIAATERVLDHLLPRPRVIYVTLGGGSSPAALPSHADVILKPFSPSELLSHVRGTGAPPNRPQGR